MAQLQASNISLTFPLYTQIQTAPNHEKKYDQNRLIRDKKGNIIGVKALSNVSFDIASSDRLAIIGRNGSGKTTLLQVLAGIMAPETGHVISEGHCTNIVNINLGIQSEATGHQNIMLRGLASGHSRASVEAKREEIAEMSGLGEFLGMPVRVYSSGMRMRLSFAIATAFDPEILILDEWLSAGDEEFRQRASEKMSEFASRASILVLASHNIDLLDKICNKALWLDGGRVKMIGAMAEVKDSFQAAMR